MDIYIYIYIYYKCDIILFHLLGSKYCRIIFIVARGKVPTKKLHFLFLSPFKDKQKEDDHFGHPLSLFQPTNKHYNIRLVCKALHGPDSSGCLVLYQRK